MAHSAGHNTQAGWRGSAAPAPEDFPSLPGAPRAPQPAPAAYRPRAPAPAPRPAAPRALESFPGLGPPARRPPGAWSGPSKPQVQPRASRVAPAPVLPTTKGGLRVLDRRVPDPEDELPTPAQPDLDLSHASRLAVKNSGQDLTYSREEHASNIRTIDRATLEALQQPARPAAAASRANLAAQDFPGLGRPERSVLHSSTLSSSPPHLLNSSTFYGVTHNTGQKTPANFG